VSLTYDEIPDVVVTGPANSRGYESLQPSTANNYDALGEATDDHDTTDSPTEAYNNLGDAPPPPPPPQPTKPSQQLTSNTPSTTSTDSDGYLKISSDENAQDVHDGTFSPI